MKPEETLAQHSFMHMHLKENEGDSQKKLMTYSNQL